MRNDEPLDIWGPYRSSHTISSVGSRTSAKVTAPPPGMDHVLTKAVLGLQPVAASPAPIEAAFPFRHDALKAEFVSLGEHDRALPPPSRGL